ncbi:hypothetical protein [Radiobacillus sp. PE A8.2]
MLKRKLFSAILTLLISTIVITIFLPIDGLLGKPKQDTIYLDLMLVGS